jgi:hypothetical protein
MLSILKFSGKSWARAAAAWALFAVIVDGLARAGADAAEAEKSAYIAAVALGALQEKSGLETKGQYQVAKVDYRALDLNELQVSDFADEELSAKQAH